MFPIRSLSDCIGAAFKVYVCCNRALESANNSQNLHPVEKNKKRSAIPERDPNMKSVGSDH